ncbi:galactitol-1-phosphate 5-dehydrogenase [Enterococcus sp. CSURQ0835]|uniref:galactitol-1-phosphate 5-dehydrogenase n=1 Tax=Enterococcus sp. CSURQ0835 TaxID=2681394 RepID=UPI00135C5593|nr:galactitol-1-phosphate 5-dehydrogenase [Enterococcus sp. CSURQ0835]
MKAALLTHLNHFEIAELEQPSLKANEVLVKVEAAGICGSDIHKMQSGWKYGFPMVMGHEFSGVITAVGTKVTQSQIGDRVVVVPFMPCNQCVYCKAGKFQLCEHYQMIGSQRYGGFEQFAVVPATNVLKISPKISFEEAAMIEPLAVAAHAVMGLDPQLGDTVVIFGLGTIGILVLQWLQLAGVKKIIGIDIDPAKLAVAKKFGVTETINPQSEPLEQRVLALTDQLGADLVLECAGSPLTEEEALLVLRKGGKLGYLGIAYADILLHQQAFENIFRREYTIQGFWNSYSAPFPGNEWRNAIAFIEQGKIKLKPLISHRFGLDQIQQAFDLTVNKTESYNKVMLYPQKKEV